MALLDRQLCLSGYFIGRYIVTTCILMTVGMHGIIGQTAVPQWNAFADLSQWLLPKLEQGLGEPQSPGW